MITSLKINNIALIDSSLINFDSGFNVLTGETGAGKSIIIDSLNFVLGARADKTLIKTGKDFAKVEVVFELNEISEAIKEFFNSIFVEPENTIVISRYFNLNGKNECRVNGEAVSLGMLKKLSVNLVDIFGQHDNVMLLDVKNHIKFIDELSLEIPKLKEELKGYLNELKSINNEINLLGGLGEDKQKNIKLLEHEINEIELSNLKENEDVELLSKQKMFLNSEKLKNNLEEILTNLTGGDQSVNSQLKNANFCFNQISELSSELGDLKNRLQNSMFDLIDISDTVSTLLNRVDYSEEELNNTMERLEAIKDLKRKYGKTIPDILLYLENSKQKLNALLNSDEQLKVLLDNKNKALNNVYKTCVKLTNERKKVGEVLSQKLIKELNDLGIKNASFVVEFNNLYNEKNIENYVTLNGADNVEFLFSANAGIEPRPLSKIISGGEMSRFMLAFKCVCRDDNKEKTMIFDEIDAGIGGQIGFEVGKKIAAISKHNQVLCVTHLAQIATFAKHYYKIEKTVDNKITSSNVKVLQNEQIVEEIARMIGSIAGSEYGKLNAKELLNEANNYLEKL